MAAAVDPWLTGTAWVAWCTDSTATTATIWADWTSSSSTNSMQIVQWPVTQAGTPNAAHASAWRAAQERAKELLEANLTEEQRAEYRKHGVFHVETKGGTRLYRLGGTPVRVHGEDGKRYSYCIHPLGQFPHADVLLAQKLLLETDEDEFLRIANASLLSAA